MIYALLFSVVEFVQIRGKKAIAFVLHNLQEQQQLGEKNQERYY